MAAERVDQTFVADWLSELSSLSDDEVSELIRDLKRDTGSAKKIAGRGVNDELAALDLVLSLHRVFADPADRLILDAASAVNAHRLLARRAAEAETLGAVTKRIALDHELPAGRITVPRRSTGVAVALGLAVARDLRGEGHAVAVVVGGRALSGGVAFEALHRAGTLRSDLVIVLDDMSTSMSSGGGAMFAYLTRLRTAPSYRQFKRDVERVLSAIPVVGDRTARAAERVKESVRRIVVPGAFFEALGLQYLGPIDGSDFRFVEAILRRARAMGGPVVVHAVIEERRARSSRLTRFDEGGPFDPVTGSQLGAPDRPLSWQAWCGKWAVQFARRDLRIVAIAAGEDAAGFGAFHAALPGRFFDLQTAEPAALSFAAGLAAAGLRPIIALPIARLAEAYGTLAQDFAPDRLPITVVVGDAIPIDGRAVGEPGAPLETGVIAAVPGVALAGPRTLDQLSRLLAAALVYDGPMLLLLPGGSVSEAPEPSVDPVPWPIGRAQVIRQGRDVALLTFGRAGEVAIRAADQLSAIGIEAMVIDMVFIQPIDREAVIEAASLGRIATLEPGPGRGGLSDAVDELLAEEGIVGVARVRIGEPVWINRHSLLREARLDPAFEAASVAERIARFVRDPGAHPRTMPLG